MSELWLVPDPDEALERSTWYALPIEQRAELGRKVLRLLSISKNDRPGQIEELARAYGVTGRTAYRYARAPMPCPGPRCLTLVKGGGLCSFCRRTP